MHIYIHVYINVYINMLYIYIIYKCVYIKYINKYINVYINICVSIYIYTPFFIFYCCSSTFVSVSPPPLLPTPAIPTSHPQSYPALALFMCPLYMFLTNLLPVPPIIPSHLHSGHCQFVLNFNVSGSILLICFVDYVPLIDEIIWYFSFTSWLISLSIMLSSSIHAVCCKG